MNNENSQERQENLQIYKRLVMLAGMASVSTAILFIVMKLIVWILTASSSIFASFTDSMFDCLASFINLLALKFSLAPPDKEHRFGHYKAQALASLAQAAFIGGSAVLLIIHGIERFENPVEVQHVGMAIGVSALTIVITFVLVLFQTYVYKRTKSEAIGADRFHYLSDVILNLAVIAALILSFKGFYWADGLFASLIGVLILKGAYTIGFKAVNTLLDKSLSAKDNSQIIAAVMSVRGVSSVHDLKTRRAGPWCFIQAHMVLNGKMSLRKAHAIADEAEERVNKIFNNAEITLHMEPDCPEVFKDIEFLDDSEEPKTEKTVTNGKIER